MLEKIFRISFCVEEFLEDNFYDVCSINQVENTKEKLLKVLEDAYERAKKWINENYPESA